MKIKLFNVIFQGVLTIMVFSIWAAFALIIVNDFFYQDLPGYQIGRLCVWELVALMVAFLINRLMIRQWGGLELILVDGKSKLTFSINYGRIFVAYFLFGVLLACWKYYQFSIGFSLPK